MLESAKKEISEICEIQSIRWKNQTKKYKGDKEMELLESKLNLNYKPNYNGPLFIDLIFSLSENPSFKDFCKLLKSEYLGPICELINLTCKGYNVLRIASFLSLEYNMIIPPNKVVKLVNYLEEEKIVNRV